MLDATRDRRGTSLGALDTRIRALEERAIADDGLHRALMATDGQTALAVEKLTKAINDPRDGLIVELDRFRAEVVADRKAFRSWVKGATFILSIVFGIVTIAAPWIQGFVEAIFRSRP